MFHTQIELIILLHSLKKTLSEKIFKYHQIQY